MLFERAQSSIPGGVNSPVRAFKSVGGTPVFLEKAKGAYLYDVDGNQYIDFINSWGPMILGHAFPAVIQSIIDTAKNSTSFGTPIKLEIMMAELIKEMVPNVDLIRMVSSGTEACMSAVRLARGFTGRNKIIKFEGCYHGHADSFLVKAGSGVATLNIQSIPGITAGVAKDTLNAPYNDLQRVHELVKENKDEIAAIIIEPVAGNMGCVLPGKGFLEGLRMLCDEENIILIFDEVMTGFRLAAGGAQEKLQVHADLLCFGKIIGGGLPVGAFGGNKNIMEHIAPLGNVYQAGTLSGNPLAMAAGYATLNELNSNKNFYRELDAKAEYLERGISSLLLEKGINHRINRLGSMISLHFCDHNVTDFDSASKADIKVFNKFFTICLIVGFTCHPLLTRVGSLVQH